MEEKLIKIYKQIVIVASLIFLVTAVIMIYYEVISPEWKDHQYAYEVFSSTNDSLQSEDQPPAGMRQIEVEEFNHIDRCITCHQGIDQYTNKSVDLPFSGHPGNILKSHDLASFGCTLCHVGNGRSLKYDETCNPDLIVDWKPVESNCSKCHLAIYEKTQNTRSPKETLNGRDIVYRTGCLGCHKLRHVGGGFGPDLTAIGDKIHQGYNFKNVMGKKSIYNWHQEHFANPEKISPGTIMPNFSFDDRQMETLATLILGFSQPTLPFRYYDLSVLSEFKGKRNNLSTEDSYTLICSACHEQKGLGMAYKDNTFGVPGLANPDFQAAASLDMISFIIQEGRSNKYMPAWKARQSGLTDNELSALTIEIRSRWKKGPTYQQVRSASSGVAAGEQLYNENCSTCHQTDKSGGIGPSLNSKSFRDLASDRFLYSTLIRGRANTAMPSWNRFNAAEIHRLIRYLQPGEKIVNAKQIAEYDKSSIAKGQDIYHYHCSRCHGEEGNGGIGPGILKRDFLQTAGDAFIIGTVKTGRGHTPMFSAIQNENDMQDLIRFMRYQQTIIKEIIHPGPTLGNPGSGKKLFQKNCSECHGHSGEGIEAPAINNQEFLNAASNGYLLATITMGRVNTPMPEWGETTEKRVAFTTKERHDLVAYIRQLQTMAIKRESTDPIYRLLLSEE